MTTPTPDAKTVADKLTSVMFVEGYVGKENLEAVNFLFTQTLTQDRAATLTLLRERVEDDMKIGCYEGCNCRLRLRNILDEVLGKE